ncbi:MAG TPA: TMEM175 family protein [Trebonia sp.]|nr:TMEM175 family protein [Trebonia sp.]
MGRGRLEAFSDGVFAVAITLLALNLAVAGPGHGPLAQQLADRWPAFVAYLISFFTIGIIWVNHHALVSNVVAVSRLLLFLNLVLLLFVVMVPFGTATTADYLAHGGFDAKVAVAIYGGVLEGMSVGFAAMLEWSLGEGRTRIPVPPGRRWVARLRFTCGGLVYLLVIGGAFVSPPAALGLSGLVAVYYIFERTPALAPAGPDAPQAAARPAPGQDP